MRTLPYDKRPSRASVETDRMTNRQAMEMARDALERAGQVIAWHLHGECRAYRSDAIPSPADVRAQIDAALSALTAAMQEFPEV